MKLETVGMYALHNHEHYQYACDVKNLYDSYVYASKFQVAYNKFVSCMNNEDIALQKTLKNDLTETIAVLDKEVEKRFRSFYNMVDASRNHFSKEMSDAGDRLIIVMDTYREGILKGNYQGQSSAVYNLIQDTRTDKYKNDIALCRVKDQQDELYRINEEFKELLILRDKQRATVTKLTVKETRLATDEAYYGLFSEISAAVLYEKTDAYNTFIKYMNETTERYNHTIKVRQGKKKSGRKNGKKEEVEE